MKIKRFQAADVRQAIREVREVLGPDAVILSNTRVDGGIEIVAATDYDESQFRRQAQPAKREEPPTTPRVEINPSFDQDEEIMAPHSTRPQQNIWSQEPTLVQMRREIAGLRDMLQSQLSDLTWKDMERQSPSQVQLMQRLLRMGIDPELARRTTQQASGIEDIETAWRQSLGKIAQQIYIDHDDFIQLR